MGKGLGRLPTINTVFRIGHKEKVTLSKYLKEFRDSAYQSGESDLAADRTVQVLRKSAWSTTQSLCLGASRTRVENHVYCKLLCH